MSEEKTGAVQIKASHNIHAVFVKSYRLFKESCEVSEESNRSTLEKMKIKMRKINEEKTS